MSGSRPGERRGGRQKGTKNKAKKVRDERMAEALQNGILPLDYMLSVVRDPTVPRHERLDAAAKAAQYIHPRLSSSESKVTVTKRDAQDWTRDELVAILDDPRTSGNGAAAEDGRGSEPDSLH